MTERNWIIVISAPSGAGKTSLVDAVLPTFSQLSRGVTTTTRQIREGEVAGVDYHFLSEEEFKSHIDQEMFYEHAFVHGKYYGTSKKSVDAIFEEGKHCVLVIDVQGARSIKAQYEHTYTIFIVPPSIEELENRLRQRGKNQEADLQKRLENARTEMAAQGEFDTVVVNDNFEKAKVELENKIKNVLGSGP